MNVFILENHELKEKLSDEEFEYYFNLYKNGDINARNVIAEHNFKLSKYVVNLYYKKDLIEKDDLYSIANIGLLKAIDNYDLNKGVKFSTYACNYILYEIKHYYRKKQISAISLEDISYINDDGEKILIDDKSLQVSDSFTEEFTDKEYVNYLLNTLSYVDRDIIEMYYGLGDYNKTYNQNEIAKKYCVSKQRISKRIIDSLKDLKHAAESPEFRNQKILKRENF